MRTQPNTTAKILSGTHYPAAATAAVVTIVAVSNERWVIRKIISSYSAVPTGGRLTVVIGGVTLVDIDITAAGPLVLDFQRELEMTHNTTNEAAVITLASGAGTVVGKLQVIYQ